LPEYMVPAAYAWMQAFPLTPHGKIDRRALPSPEAAPPSAVAAEAQPRDELESLVARLGCEALGVARVSREDNFFDLGGHSLLVVQIHRRLRAELQREFSVVALFQHATVAALADYLRAAPEAAAVEDDEAQDRARRQREARQRRR